MTPEELMEARKQTSYYGDKLYNYGIEGKIPRLETGEHVVQCLPPYQAFWAVTNYARVFSLKGNDIVELKPYTRHGDPYRKFLDGYDEHCKRVGFLLHRIVADHFCQNLTGSDIYHVHHIKPARLFTLEENEKNIPHRAVNLEIVEPNYQHTALTFLQEHPTLNPKEAEEYVRNLTKRAINDPNLISLNDIKEPEIREAILQMIQSARKEDIRVSRTDGNGAAWTESGVNVDWNNIEPIVTIIR